MIKNQTGQIIIILLLTMLIALAIGLAVTQRTITDVTTSTQSEQSSRSFAAAEAALEKILPNPSCAPTSTTCSSLNLPNLGNEASANVTVSPPLPQSQQALEYPPVGKETVAQFWLANPTTVNIDPYYPGSQIDVYLGYNPTDLKNYDPNDKPAIELNLISRDSGGNYNSSRSFYDTDSSRTGGNGFSPCPPSATGINTSNSKDTATTDRLFLCRVALSIPAGQTPIMVRARILYSNKSQTIAVKPASGLSLPPQARYYTSKGTTGNSQKVVQVFRLIYVVPQFFDFAIFSASYVSKTGF